MAAVAGAPFTMTPFDDFVYLINHVLLGEEPTIEDFILLVGTLVAFIAFILWCCFPIHPKEAGQHRQFSCKILKSHIKAFDKPTNNEDTTANKSNSGFSSSNHSNTQYGLNNTSYSKNGTVPCIIIMLRVDTNAALNVCLCV